MAKAIPTYAWDANVFLAWLGARVADDFDMSLLEAVVLEISDGKANLVTSSMAELEVLHAKHKRAKIKKFQNFLKRSNVTVLDMHRGVVLKGTKCTFKMPQAPNP